MLPADIVPESVVLPITITDPSRGFLRFAMAQILAAYHSPAGTESLPSSFDSDTHYSQSKLAADVSPSPPDLTSMTPLRA